MRILPPYYAAISLALAQPYLRGVLTSILKKTHISEINHPSVNVIVSHFLLVQNINADWIGKIDAPTWSIATEWQIYFIFALILLPIWRLFGNWAVLAISIIIGLAPHFLLPKLQNLDWACPWFVVVFAEGMIGAALAFSGSVKIQRILTNRNTAIAVTIVSIILYFNYIWFTPTVLQHWWWCLDLFAGIPVLYIILQCIAVNRSESGQKGFRKLLALLESKYVLKLGLMSYSLYLLHWLVLQEMDTVIVRHIHYRTAMGI